jgi:hypothetical protein
MISYTELNTAKEKGGIETVNFDETNLHDVRLAKKKNLLSNCTFLIIALTSLVGLCFLMSNQLSHDQKLRFLKPTLFWENLMVDKVINLDQCVTESPVNSTEFLNGPVVQEFTEFINFLNFNKKFDYFLCFSTLFYASKLERYETLTIKDLDKIEKYEDECVLWEHAKEDKVNSVAHIHLCSLRNEQSRSIPSLVSEFKNYYDENMPKDSESVLMYNRFSGEFQLVFAENLKISFHEYVQKYKLVSDKLYDSKSILDHLHAPECLDKNKDFAVDEKVRLSSGLMTQLFGYDSSFSIPLSFFKKNDFTYVKYLNTLFKLPSQLDEYLNYFYPEFSSY